MLKEVLKNLPAEDRKQLLYAFENDLEQFIQLEGPNFIGVNISGHNYNLKIDFQEGVWSMGRVLNNNKEFHDNFGFRAQEAGR